MELRHYLVLFKRWVWLLVLGVVLGVVAGYVVSRYQTAVYQAVTKVLIMQAPEDQVFNILSQNDQQLAQTFTELLVTRPIIDGTSERLGYAVSSNQVRVQRVRDAQLIQVTVQDNDPGRAAQIANTLVQVFLEQNDALQASRFAASEESLQAQLQQVEKQINDLQSQLTLLSEKNFDTQISDVTEMIAGIQAEIRMLQEEIVDLQYSNPPVETRDDQGRKIYVTATPTLNNRRELSIKSDRLIELQALRSLYQNIYVQLAIAKNGAGSGSFRDAEQIQAAVALYQQIHANLLSNYEAVRLARLKSTPNIVQVEEALPRGAPIRPRPMINMFLGGIVGLFICGAIAFVIEYVDDTLRTPEEVTELLQLPILAYIGEMSRTGLIGDDHLKPHVLANPRSPVAESFRTLRTNLEFAELDKPLKTLLVSSADSSEGKTTVSVNLAIVSSQSGKSVYLLDADLRRPRIHTAMNIANLTGLSDVLREHAQIESVAQNLDGGQLSVITSGSLPPNPVEVLNSEKMAQTLSDLKDMTDLVIIDGPPFLLADASVLAARVDGVLLVIRLRKTRAAAALSMMDQLDRAGARVVGVVINRINRKENGYYYYRGNKDYSSYAYDIVDNGSLVKEDQK